MKFREHRGSLEDSMATVVEIGNTYSDVCEKAREVLASCTPALEPGEIMLPSPVYLTPVKDDRIGWDGFFVNVTGWGVVGLIDGLPEGTDPRDIYGGTPANTPSEVVEVISRVIEVTVGGLVPGQSSYTYAPAALEVAVNDFDTTVVDTMYPEGKLLVEDRLFDWDLELKHKNQDGTDKPKVRPYAIYDMIDSGGLTTQFEEEPGQEIEPVDKLVEAILDHGVATMGSYSGADFFDSLKEKLEAGNVAEALFMLDSIPPELEAMKEVTKGTVVLPDAEHMSEAMVDSTRGMHLYYMEGGSGVTCEQMRKHLSRYAPWAEKHYPQWFREETSHLTKGGRAILAHALTIGAHKDPEARKYYFKAESIRRQRVWDNPMHQRIRLTFKPMVMGEVFDGGGFVIHRPFLDARPIGNDRFSLQLNRADMPKVHRGKFKTEAFVLVLELTEGGMNVNFIEWQVNPKLSSSSYEVIPAMASRW